MTDRVPPIHPEQRAAFQAVQDWETELRRAEAALDHLTGVAAGEDRHDAETAHGAINRLLDRHARPQGGLPPLLGVLPGVPDPTRCTCMDAVGPRQQAATCPQHGAPPLIGVQR